MDWNVVLAHVHEWHKYIFLFTVLVESLINGVMRTNGAEKS